MKKIPALMVFCASIISLNVLAQGSQVVSLSANANTMVSRTPDSRGWTDPALNHNKLLQNQTSEGMYKLIGPYKVIGSQFLYGEHLAGDLYTPETMAKNIYLSYNVYNQEVEFYSSSNPNQSLVRETGTVDSFTLHSDPGGIPPGNLRFLYGKILNSSDKAYFLEMYKGPKYSLYKKYTAELNMVSTNIVQSDLRQFDLQYNYYVYDETKKSLKKFKTGYGNMLKEFKSIQDLSTISADEYSVNPDAALQKAFGVLNQ